MFYVYFTGNSNNGENIEALNMKSAKWIFALKNNLNSIGYVSAKRVK